MNTLRQRLHSAASHGHVALVAGEAGIGMTSVLRELAALRELGPEIQWVQSYVAGDKIYCVYNAPSEAWIRSHAARSGFPANRITPVAAVIDPTTARPAQ